MKAPRLAQQAAGMTRFTLGSAFNRSRTAPAMALRCPVHASKSLGLHIVRETFQRLLRLSLHTLPE